MDDGDCVHTCKFCGALFWFGEKAKKDSKKRTANVFSMCCLQGKVELPPVTPSVMSITTQTPKLNPVIPPAPDNLMASEVTFQPDLPEEKEGTLFTRIRANCNLRRKWQKAKVIDHVSDEVWCMAGYTYSQQLAEAEHHSKPSKSFDDMVPEPY